MTIREFSTENCVLMLRKVPAVLIYSQRCRKRGGGARSALFNAINSFQQSIRKKHKSSWNGNLNGRKGFFFPLKIALLQHF